MRHKKEAGGLAEFRGVGRIEPDCTELILFSLPSRPPHNL
jgi:hypothetical protein